MKSVVNKKVFFEKNEKHFSVKVKANNLNGLHFTVFKRFKEF